MQGSLINLLISLTRSDEASMDEKVKAYNDLLSKTCSEQNWGFNR